VSSSSQGQPARPYICSNASSRDESEPSAWSTASEPGLDPVGIPQVRELAPGADEGALQCVLGEARVAKDPEGDRVQPVTDLVHQAGEGVTVSLACPLHEVSIHLDLQGVAPDGAIWTV
jgi:hypothetical protein